MSSALIIFWICLITLFYCYLGYGIILYVLNRFKKRNPGHTTALEREWPPVTIIVAAYNERPLLDRKIRNTLDIDYPAGRLRMIIVTDGSTDGSGELASSYPSVRFLHLPERKGKTAALKRAMKEVETEFVLFSDANSFLNRECIRRMIPHYDDPGTGGVAGEKKILDPHHHSAVGEAEGLYWEYESFLKKQDAGLYTVVGAAGELFSIRTPLFREPVDAVVLDDFYISMQVCLQGYKIEYEPGAYATESPSASLADEEKRKVRISAGAYQAVGYLKECFHVTRHPLLSFQYFSRRLLRWIVCPPFLILLLASNIFLAAHPGIPLFYLYFLFAQLLFYVLALAGWLLVRRGRKSGLLTIPFYFVFMNTCLVKGFFRFLKGGQSVIWEKAERGG